MAPYAITPLGAGGAYLDAVTPLLTPSYAIALLRCFRCAAYMQWHCKGWVRPIYAAPPLYKRCKADAATP